MGKDRADSSAATSVAVVLLAILGIGLVGLLTCGIVGFYFVGFRTVPMATINSSSTTYVDSSQALTWEDAPATGERGQAEKTLDEIRKALDVYKLDVGSYPTTVEGLSALVDRPEDLPQDAKLKWQGPYAKQIPEDPWGQAYRYECDGQDYVRAWSVGPDGIDGTADDIQVQITTTP
jgi:type II secretion system protein G